MPTVPPARTLSGQSARLAPIRCNACESRVGCEQHDGVITEVELLATVEAAFQRTGRGLAGWPDPHAGGAPGDTEYSRVSDPRKWLIVGARAQAWIDALVEPGFAAVQAERTVHWAEPPGTVISRTDQLLPRAAGALPLVVARSKIADVDDAGVTLGVGKPAVVVAWIPQCGCDACDSGSQSELDELDDYMVAIVTGRFRRLSAGNQVITVIAEGRWSTSGLQHHRDVDKILEDPTGWHELSGTSWLQEH
jgi:hypothetical protein